MTTSTMKGPVSANALTIQCSKSLPGPLRSEVNTRRLRNIVIEQSPEWRLMAAAIPGLELGERVLHRNGLEVDGFGKVPEDRLADQRETREHLTPRLALGAPA